MRKAFLTAAALLACVPLFAQTETGHLTPCYFSRGGNAIVIDNGCTVSLQTGGAIKTASGVGTKATSTAVSVAEYGTSYLHKTVLTLTNYSLTMTDATTAGSQGSLEIYDFPEGVIEILGASYNLTIARVGTAIGATAAVVGSLGSATAGVDNATLTTTEADLIASTAGTLTAGAGALAKHGSMVTTAYDGHTTAIKAYLNAAIPDADSSGNDALMINGTVTITWVSLGDY